MTFFHNTYVRHLKGLAVHTLCWHHLLSSTHTMCWCYQSAYFLPFSSTLSTECQLLLVTMSSEHSETDISTMSESDTQVLMQLMAPDGYYTYLKIPKPASDKDEIDLVLLKKNYRKLSLSSDGTRGNLSCSQSSPFGIAAFQITTTIWLAWNWFRRRSSWRWTW